MNCEYDIGAAKQLAKSVLQNNPPSAVICCNDVIAHGFLYACQNLGIKVPEEISIVGIGDFGGSEHLEPGLTTVRLPAKRIGIQAADTLLEMSDTGLPPKQFAQAIDLEFMERASTRKI